MPPRRIPILRGGIADKTDLTLEKIIDELDRRTALMQDFVVEQGTLGMWSFRKWNSGIAECWGRKVHQSVAVNTEWGSGFYGTITAPENYPFTFASYPTVNITVQGSNGNGIGIYNNTNYSVNNAGNAYIYNPTRLNDVTITANYHVIGRVDTSKSVIKLMQYNVGHWNYGSMTDGIPANVYEEKIRNLRRFFAYNSPDIVTMQENTRYIDRAGTITPDDALFDAYYPDGYTEQIRSTIKSRTPATSFDGGLFTASVNRIYTTMDFTVDGNPIKLINVHLHPSDYNLQVADLQEAITMMQSTPNSIICGDFNVTTANRDALFGIAQNAGYKLANGGNQGWHPTWEANNPTWFIDNILVRGNITVRSISVPNTAQDLVSDHLPLIAELLIG